MTWDEKSTLEPGGVEEKDLSVRRQTVALRMETSVKLLKET